MARLRRASVAVGLACFIAAVGCSKSSAPPPASATDAAPPQARAEEAVVDFLATLFADPDFVREMQPIQALCRAMQLIDVTLEGGGRYEQRLSSMWRVKAEPIFRAHIRRTGIDMEAVKAFLKSYAAASDDARLTVVKQILDRMPEDKRPGACDPLVMSFLHHQLNEEPVSIILSAAVASARRQWKDFRSVRPIESTRLRRLFPKADAFCVVVFNPISQIAGRPTFLHTLMMAGQDDTFIESDEDACRALLRTGAKPADAPDALDLALAFGELRNYVLQSRVDSVSGAEPLPQDWRTVIAERGKGWLVSCTFVTDPTIQLCQRYQITVTREGEVTAEKGKVVSRSGGYR